MLPRPVPQMRKDKLGRLRSTRRQRHAVGARIPKMHLLRGVGGHTPAWLWQSMVAPLIRCAMSSANCMMFTSMPTEPAPLSVSRPAGNRQVLAI